MKIIFTRASIAGMNELKNFEEWMPLKKSLHFNAKHPRVLDGEIWWCSFGENVGVEINGKSKRFTRPVLILQKLSSFSFMGIPLTSQEKTGSWYAEFVFRSKREFAAICQARVLSVYRLHSKIGRVPESDLENVRKAFHKLYK